MGMILKMQWSSANIFCIPPEASILEIITYIDSLRTWWYWRQSIEGALLEASRIHIRRENFTYPRSVSYLS